MSCAALHWLYINYVVCHGYSPLGTVAFHQLRYTLESPSGTNCVHSQQIEPIDRGHV
jgi:hypothetical protein